MHADTPATELERRFERVDEPGAIGAAEAQPVLNDLEHAATPRVHTRIALLGEQVEDLGLAEVVGHFHGKGHDHARVASRLGARRHLGGDALGRVPADRGAAVPAVKRARRARTAASDDR